MKSAAVSGVVYSRESRELPRSLAITVAENSVTKDSPNTVMPGVICWISNRLTGTLACIAVSNNSKTRGKPNPKHRFSGSRTISLALRPAKVIMRTIPPP